MLHEHWQADRKLPPYQTYFYEAARGHLCCLTARAAGLADQNITGLQVCYNDIGEEAHYLQSVGQGERSKSEHAQARGPKVKKLLISVPPELEP